MERGTGSSSSRCTLVNSLLYAYCYSSTVRSSVSRVAGENNNNNTSVLSFPQKSPTPRPERRGREGGSVKFPVPHNPESRRIGRGVEKRYKTKRKTKRKRKRKRKEKEKKKETKRDRNHVFSIQFLFLMLPPHTCAWHRCGGGGGSSIQSDESGNIYLYSRATATPWGSTRNRDWNDNTDLNAVFPRRFAICLQSCSR